MSTGASGSRNGVCGMLWMVFSHNLYGMMCRGGLHKTFSPNCRVMDPVKASRVSSPRRLLEKIEWRHHSDSSASLGDGRKSYKQLEA
jgi:hypothetical protein